jgi:hypothetical protein
VYNLKNKKGEYHLRDRPYMDLQGQEDNKRSIENIVLDMLPCTYFFSEQVSYKETTTSIFKGITIYVNGYTVPSQYELKRMVNLHGGHYEHYYSKAKVTEYLHSVC